jgi:hypothetical protein
MPNGERVEEIPDSEFTDEINLEDDDDEQETSAADGGEDQESDDEDDEPEETPVNTAKQEVVLRVEQPPTRKERGRRKRPRTQEDQDYEDVDQLIEELDPGAATRVYLTLSRVEPKIFKGKRIAGYVDKIDRHINTQEIKDLYGGGTYDLIFFAPKKSGRGNKMIRRKRIEITGDPIVQLDFADAKGSGFHSSHDPDIVSQAMKAQQNVVDRLEAKSREEKDTIMTLLSKKDDGKESMAVFMKMMEVQEKKAEAQLEAIREEARQAREEARRKEEEAKRKEELHREELRELRKEMDEKKSATGDTMIQFMREQSGENMKRMELTMKSMADNSKVMMEMMAGNHKSQAELLTNELKRVSEELKDARLSNKGDLVSEMKKMSTLQHLMKDIAGGGQEDKSLTDKLSDNLPEILESVPGILQGIGGLFRGQRVTQQATARQMTGVGGAPAVPRRMLPGATRQAPLPPRRPQQPSSFPVNEQESSDEPVGVPAAPFVPQQQQQQQEQQPVSEDQQVKIAQEIAKLKLSFEQSLTQGEAATTCYQNHIMGKYDEELLRKIAAMPTPSIILFLQQNLDDDSPLFTVKGKDFLRKIHGIIKEKYA